MIFAIRSIYVRITSFKIYGDKDYIHCIHFLDLFQFVTKAYQFDLSNNKKILTVANFLLFSFDVRCVKKSAIWRCCVQLTFQMLITLFITVLIFLLFILCFIHFFCTLFWYSKQHNDRYKNDQNTFHLKIKSIKKRSQSPSATHWKCSKERKQTLAEIVLFFIYTCIYNINTIQLLFFLLLFKLKKHKKAKFVYTIYI